MTQKRRNCDANWNQAINKITPSVGRGVNEMANTSNLQVVANDMSLDFLLLSNPFEAAIEVSSAERIYKLVKNGSFALGRQTIIAAFQAAASQTTDGQAVNVKAIVKLCLEITAESYKSTNPANHLKIWFDPFTARVEMQAGNGLKDSLSIWSNQQRIAA